MRLLHTLLDLLTLGRHSRAYVVFRLHHIDYGIDHKEWLDADGEPSETPVPMDGATARLACRKGSIPGHTMAHMEAAKP